MIKKRLGHRNLDETLQRRLKSERKTELRGAYGFYFNAISVGFDYTDQAPGTNWRLNETKFTLNVMRSLTVTSSSHASNDVSGGIQACVKSRPITGRLLEPT